MNTLIVWTLFAALFAVAFPTIREVVLSLRDNPRRD
jgi:hypothetical protein